MSSDKMDRYSQSMESSREPRKLILFVVGDEPNSRIARLNLDKLSRVSDTAFEYEIIDVLEDYRAALKHEVMATPALVQVSPANTVLGNLNDTARVLSALGMQQREHST